MLREPDGHSRGGPGSVGRQLSDRAADAARAGKTPRAIVIQLRTFVGKLRGWRRRATGFAAGALSVLAMAPFHFWPVLFLTLPIGVWLLDSPATSQRPLRAAAGDGWWFGFGYFFFGLFWIGEAFLVEAHIFGWLLPFAVTLMPAGLALFWAAIFASAKFFWRDGLSRVLVLAIAFAVGEYLRGHIMTGFPWNVLGYALTGDDFVMQSAAILGIYGLTALTVIICATPLVVLAGSGGRSFFRKTSAIAVCSLLPLAALYAYGLAILPSEPSPSVPGVKLRIVQPSVPQHHKWAREKQGEIFNNHLLLSTTNESGERTGLAGITHLVWPEAAMPFLPLATPQALAAIDDLLSQDQILIAGALRLERSQVGDEVRPSVKPRSKVFNSMIVFAPDGSAAAIYDKLHLVPFGEYLPFAGFLESIGLQSITRIRGGFAEGPSPRPLLAVPGLQAVAPLICYEAIFPAAVIQSSKRPELMINVTNDGWFGNTTGPYQHFHQSRLRAVEEGLPLVRAANNGISAMIDSYGRVVKAIGLNVRGVIDVPLPVARPPTFYAIYGDCAFLVIVALLALAAWGMMSYPLALDDP